MGACSYVIARLKKGPRKKRRGVKDRYSLSRMFSVCTFVHSKQGVFREPYHS